MKLKLKLWLGFEPLRTPSCVVNLSWLLTMFLTICTAMKTFIRVPINSLKVIVIMKSLPLVFSTYDPVFIELFENNFFSKWCWFVKFSGVCFIIFKISKLTYNFRILNKLIHSDDSIAIFIDSINDLINWFLYLMVLFQYISFLDILSLWCSCSWVFLWNLSIFTIASF